MVDFLGQVVGYFQRHVEWRHAHVYKYTLTPCPWYGVCTDDDLWPLKRLTPQPPITGIKNRSRTSKTSLSACSAVRVFLADNVPGCYRCSEGVFATLKLVHAHQTWEVDKGREGPIPGGYGYQSGSKVMTSGGNCPNPTPQAPEIMTCKSHTQVNDFVLHRLTSKGSRRK